MRSVAYAAAILAAAGIMYFIATGPTKPSGDAAAASQDPAPVVTESIAIESEAADSTTGDVDIKTASLTMNVPEMHCPFACYPSVKENLEKQDDVISVELAPQKEEGVIDNRQVIVTYKEGFDPKKAIAVLDSVGFAGSSVAKQ